MYKPCTGRRQDESNPMHERLKGSERGRCEKECVNNTLNEFRDDNMKNVAYGGMDI